jgi:transposase-like protein
MLRPRPPVDGIRPDRFRPPHCPRIDCPAHLARRRFRFRRAGSYCVQCDPKRKIPRFYCCVCNRTFSRKSFSPTYYMKRPELLLPIAAGLVAGSAHRQLARTYGCAASTVTRLAARIGRHALLFQAQALEQLDGIPEAVVLDHFETFVFSQDDRLGIATPSGHSSWFVYGIDPAPHRRTGPRGVRKRTPRHALPEPLPESVVASTTRVLDLLFQLDPQGLELISDEHPAYRSGVRRHSLRARIRHRIFPNPDRGPTADRARTRARDAAMFPVDLFHKLWRHTQAHHRRETIAFGRRSNAVLERAFLMCVWRNFIKGVSERKPDRTTPAMRLGLTDRPWRWLELFSRRLFPNRLKLPPGWRRIYRREWTTPAVGTNVRHHLVHAY